MITLVPILFRPKGVTLPPQAAYEVFHCLKNVQRRCKEVVGQTFKLASPVSAVSKQTWAEIRQTSGGFQHWRSAVRELGSRIQICRRDRAHYLFYFRPGEEPPPYEHLVGLGGMVGVENFGCDHDRPGIACMADQMAWLLAGEDADTLKARKYQVPWFAEKSEQAEGAVLHEIVHIVCDLPHVEATNPPNIMSGQWGDPKATLNAEQIAVIRGTGLLG